MGADILECEDLVFERSLVKSLNGIGMEKNGKLCTQWKRWSQIGIGIRRRFYYSKLLPFAKKCIRTRPQTVVQEDKAPAHAHHY